MTLKAPSRPPHPTGSSHDVPLDRPDVIVQTVDGVVAEVAKVG